MEHSDDDAPGALAGMDGVLVAIATDDCDSAPAGIDCNALVADGGSALASMGCNAMLSHEEKINLIWPTGPA